MFIYHILDAVAILLLYVDDILFTASNNILPHHIITLLKGEFSMNDLGNLHYFFGIQVLYNSIRVFLFQHKYIHKLLEQAHISDSKPVVTLTNSQTPLSIDDVS